jgi:hypothetical protein
MARTYTAMRANFGEMAVGVDVGDIVNAGLVIVAQTTTVAMLRRRESRVRTWRWSRARYSCTAG